MSVRNLKFIVYGAQIPYEQYDSIVGDDYDLYKKYDLTYDHKNEKSVGFVIDGMCGEYAVVGKVLKHYNEDSDPLPDGVSKLNDIFVFSLSKEEKETISAEISTIIGYVPKNEYLFINHYC